MIFLRVIYCDDFQEFKLQLCAACPDVGALVSIPPGSFLRAGYEFVLRLLPRP
ncbi:MAG: hypothetical protein KME07_06415 [Pegethrix bostrychoides GSE-TBD4-15B]|jgi:hypothetical protein|uniref:Uncharacterized protein n=1 Tax=Pegethrix bostrychoides GSE-TBD4-15B TaxID=2839662 RepID=A0A951U3V6_9CYAN|nr:hypothetical protein [Pegethrix bostrychoides GSE-TBD4-15B]